ncbi:MAG: DNA translocase FtsK, partial [Clostridia bacterium]|nr:DNA translocase FtsK [Clostridia bacterium]
MRRFLGSVGEACSSAFRTVGDGAAALHDRLWCRDEAEALPPSRAKSPGKRRGQSGKERRTMADKEENEVKSADTAEAEDLGGASDDAEEVSWNQQLSSIIFGVLSLLMLALIVFPGEHFWTVLHNFIFGILGNMAIFWNALLVYSGYMFAKQKGAMRILEITRGAAGILITIDVMTYILIQSNGYRTVEHELAYDMLALIGQIYEDGRHLGGTGLIGGLMGEILLAIVGKMGGVILCALALFGLSMLISHTTPVALIETVRSTVRRGWRISTAMFREELPQYVRSLFVDDDEAVISFADDGETEEDEASQEHPPAPDDIFVFTDEDPGEALPPVAEGEEPSAPDSILEQSIGDVMQNLAARVKGKKKKQAEVIREEQEAISQAIEEAALSETDAAEEPAYQFPGLKLLIAPKNTGDTDTEQEIRETADRLITALEEYGVKASVSDTRHGPTVTRYEITPAPGVKINKITNLASDIALRLAAQSIRIEAPIPGKSAVGIEIPNKNKQMVRIREILGSPEFANAKGSLTVALGKDIEGHIVLCDLSEMPHLLIAGSTGSGKSVCVNSILMSILYKYAPSEVRMVLIDPKSVEFDMYNGIPHLLVPVVCEPKKAAGALQWAVSEMLKRYGMLKERGVRNIANYNRLAEETGEFEKMCRIVIVIDEMADLMIAAPKEVEDSIGRLAAMARAAGMYMILATQRPSVDVITGTIKNNIPSRIAFAVPTQVDSRTILDVSGAENLIGYGDMLYHPMTSNKHTRVQGCFVD